jgi:hypothetical protein
MGNHHIWSPQARFPLLTHHFRSEYAAGLIAAAAGFYTRSALYAFTLGPGSRQLMTTAPFQALTHSAEARVRIETRDGPG